MKNGHGPRVKCPRNSPMMCASKACGGGKDYCCEPNCDNHGGPRPCTAEVSTEAPTLSTTESVSEPTTMAPTTPLATTKAPATTMSIGAQGPCPWVTWATPHDGPGMALCEDGSYGWRCMKNGHGPRVKCPSHSPMMCASKACGGGEDYCCEPNCDNHGGPRPCPQTTQQVTESTTKAPSTPLVTTKAPATTTSIEATTVAVVSTTSVEAQGPCTWATWATPHDGPGMALCEDGSYGWRCMKNGHGPRVKCPSHSPMMCASKACGGGEDYCCEPNCDNHGGPRPCPQTTQLVTESTTMAPSTPLVTTAAAASSTLPTPKSVTESTTMAPSTPVVTTAAVASTMVSSTLPTTKSVTGSTTTVPSAPLVTTAAATPTTSSEAPVSCTWLTPHNDAAEARCKDGSYSWQCVKGGHGQRIQCPRDLPVMCASKACGGGEDYCCEPSCNHHGGPRPCLQSPSPSLCTWLTPHNNDERARCKDGSYRWQCVKGGHGQRIQCPRHLPEMCASKTCGGGEDYCCEPSCDNHGGPRPCAGTPPPTPAVTPRAPLPIPAPPPGCHLPEEFKTTVQTHNIYRCMAGVPLMSWDCDLAKNAKAWADKGIFQHSPYEMRVIHGSEAGENLAVGHFGPAAAVSFWYDEIRYTNPYGLAEHAFAHGNVVGHYTGIVWRNSLKVGCATGHAMWKGLRYPLVVCQYSPGGNIAGQFTSQVHSPWRSVEECGGTQRLLPHNAPSPPRRRFCYENNVQVPCKICYKRRSLVANGGVHIGGMEPYTSIEDCKAACSSMEACKSFALCTGQDRGCWFKKKTVGTTDPAAGMTPGLRARNCSTYMEVACPTAPS